MSIIEEERSNEGGRPPPTRLVGRKTEEGGPDLTRCLCLATTASRDTYHLMKVVL